MEAGRLDQLNREPFELTLAGRGTKRCVRQSRTRKASTEAGISALRERMGSLNQRLTAIGSVGGEPLRTSAFRGLPRADRW